MTGRASGWAAWRAKKGAGKKDSFAHALRSAGAKLEARPSGKRGTPGAKTDARLAAKIETARVGMSSRLAKAYGVGQGRPGGPGARAGYRAAHEKAVDRAYDKAARPPFKSRIRTR